MDRNASIEYFAAILNLKKEYYKPERIEKVKDKILELEVPHTKTRHNENRGYVSSLTEDAFHELRWNVDDSVWDEVEKNAIQDIYYSSLGNSRDARSMIKKADKLLKEYSDNEYGLKSKEMATIALALFTEIENLSVNIVERSKLAKPKVVSPDQVRGTCSHCLRNIAIDSPKSMAIHGYEKAGLGFFIGECSGSKYPPLEISTIGLSENIKGLKQRYARMDANKPPLPPRSIRQESGETKEDYLKRYKLWENDCDHYQIMKNIELSIPVFEAELVKWNDLHAQGAFKDFLKGTVFDPDRNNEEQEKTPEM